MAMYPCLSLPSLSFPSVSGAVCSFDSQYAGLPLKAHEVAIDYTGSAISGVNVYNSADITTLPFYSGLKNGTYMAVDIANLTINRDTTLPEVDRYFAYITGIKSIPNNTKGNIACYGYEAESLNVFNTNKRPGVLFGSGLAVYFTTPVNQYPSKDAFKAAMSGYYLIYELATSTTPISDSVLKNVLASFGIYDESFNITFDTPIYGGSYDCLTGIVTSDKDSGGGDVSPTYQQTATANCETNLGVNNIWADTGDTTLQYIKLG